MCKPAPFRPPAQLPALCLIQSPHAHAARPSQVRPSAGRRAAGRAAATRGVCSPPPCDGRRRRRTAPGTAQHSSLANRRLQRTGCGSAFSARWCDAHGGGHGTAPTTCAEAVAAGNGRALHCSHMATLHSSRAQLARAHAFAGRNRSSPSPTPNRTHARAHRRMLTVRVWVRNRGRPSSYAPNRLFDARSSPSGLT